MMDLVERTLLASTVREAIASGPDVDAALERIGWIDMLRSEPDDAVAIVFTALGAANANASVLDDVIVQACGHEPRSDLAVLLAPGVASRRAPTANKLLVGPEVVPMPAITPLRGIDPDAGLYRVAVRSAVDAPPLARRAVAHQIAGACRTMLDLARTHALEREQFGRPIARFQAVRHRLADAFVAVEALDAALDAAADEPSPMTAALAKAIAGRTARTVAAHCQQVLAGIGFTTEHAFHRYLKRTMLLDALLGSADELTVAVGRELLATRTVPTLIELEEPS